MAKKKKGIISAAEAERRATHARRRQLLRKAQRGDQAAVAELIAGGERKGFWAKLLG